MHASLHCHFPLITQKLKPGMGTRGLSKCNWLYSS